MNTRHLKSSRLLATLAAVLFAISCLAIVSCGDGGSAVQNDPQAEYAAAVLDAQAMTAAKLSRDLTALVPENKNLAWEKGVPGTRVLVATWIGSQAACQNYLDPGKPGCKAGQECTNYGFNSWVTVVPELKNLVGSERIRDQQRLGRGKRVRQVLFLDRRLFQQQLTGAGSADLKPNFPALLS